LRCRFSNGFFPDRQNYSTMHRPPSNRRCRDESRTKRCRFAVLIDADNLATVASELFEVAVGEPACAAFAGFSGGQLKSWPYPTELPPIPINSLLYQRARHPTLRW
jgi:hypothetical protein